MKNAICFIDASEVDIEIKRRIRKHGIEYYGKVLQKSPWSFSYIHSFEGKEIFFYPFETAEDVKRAIIRCVLNSQRKKNRNNLTINNSTKLF
jgi:hypothetical protein